MGTRQTKGKLFRHLAALCVGFMPLLATVGLIHSAQKPQPSVQLAQAPVAAAAVTYSFPVFNAPTGLITATATTNALDSVDATQRNDTPSVLFSQDLGVLLEQYQFDTAILEFTTHGLPESPVALLPVISPTAVMTFSHPEKTSQVLTVVLDPGHGGSDPGTIGVAGLLEKELTLEIANRVKNLLLPHPNIKIKLTRSNDRGFSRANRVRHIRSAEGDLLVSLHLNNIPQRELTVVESYYADRENIIESELERQLQESVGGGGMVKTSLPNQKSYAYTKQSRRIAEILQQSIFREVARDNPEAINAGVKKETLYTLTRSEIPGTLIELTCLSNKSEERRLKSSEYRQKIAESIAEGLLEYASIPAPVEGSV